MGKGRGKAAADNRSNQMNPNNPAYQSSRASKAAAVNRSNQLNDNNEAYWSSRGEEKPESESQEDE